MAKKATTKDELFLIKLHQFTCARGEEVEIDRYEVGKAIGQNDKGVDTIVNLLAQANFVKKGEGSLLFLTPHGANLVAALKEGG